MLFKKPKKFSKYLGFYCNKICCLELQKIAKSGCADREKETYLYLLRSSDDDVFWMNQIKGHKLQIIGSRNTYVFPT